MNEHQKNIEEIFIRLCGLFKLQNFQLKFMRRQIDEQGRGVLNLKKSYVTAYTNLKTKIVTIDIYTPKFRRPKAMNSILRILIHEITHHQKPPFRQRWQGRIITRQHYPAFYRQVNKNIDKIKKDKILKEYFKSR